MNRVEYSNHSIGADGFNYMVFGMVDEAQLIKELQDKGCTEYVEMPKTNNILTLVGKRWQSQT